MRKGIQLDQNVALMRAERLEKVRAEKQAKAAENSARFNVGQAVIVTSSIAGFRDIGEVTRKTKTKIYVKCAKRSYDFRLHDLTSPDRFSTTYKIEGLA